MSAASSYRSNAQKIQLRRNQHKQEPHFNNKPRNIPVTKSGFRPITQKRPPQKPQKYYKPSYGNPSTFRPINSKKYRPNNFKKNEQRLKNPQLEHSSPNIFRSKERQNYNIDKVFHEDDYQYDYDYHYFDDPANEEEQLRKHSIPSKYKFIEDKRDKDNFRPSIQYDANPKPDYEDNSDRTYSRPERDGIVNFPQSSDRSQDLSPPKRPFKPVNFKTQPKSYKPTTFKPPKSTFEDYESIENLPNVNTKQKETIKEKRHIGSTLDDKGKEVSARVAFKNIL